jgi:hypothetical protein
MTIFDESLIDTIIQENFIANNINYKYVKTDSSFVLKTKDTSTELKSFAIYLNKFNTELFISYTEIKYIPKILQRKWMVRCTSYKTFNKALEYLTTKE